MPEDLLTFETKAAAYDWAAAYLADEEPGAYAAVTPAGAQGNGLLVHKAQAQLQSVCKEEPVLWEHTWQEGTPSEALDFCGWLSACMLYPAPVTLRKYLLGWRPKDGWPCWTAEDWEAAYLP